MKIQLHNGLQAPQEINATRVLVLDKFDQPVALAVEVDDGLIIAETASNTAEFRALLRNLGINKTFVVHDVEQKSSPEIEPTDSAF